jgi:GT2 family glycosyltransferase
MGVTGLVLPSQLDTEAQLLFERYGGMSKGMRARSFTAATMPEAAVFAAHHFGVGANMAFRRLVFERVGGFDTMLDVGTPAGGAGDLDMFHRVLAAGFKIRYEPDALLWHRHRRTHAALRRQVYANGRSYGVYLIKTWMTGRSPGAVKFAPRWLFGWVVRGLLRGITGREDFPLALRWAEFRGALSAPLAYLATVKHDRRIREEYGPGGIPL